VYASVAAELEKQQPGRYIMSFTFPRSAAGLALLTALAAGCGTAAAAHSPATAPAMHHSARPDPAPPAASPAMTPHLHHAHPAAVAPAPPPAPPAPPTMNPIPQGNGGDQDADNNGGPSDGDGSI
jgi:hypothetical protein